MRITTDKSLVTFKSNSTPVKNVPVFALVISGCAFGEETIASLYARTEMFLIRMGADYLGAVAGSSGRSYAMPILLVSLDSAEKVLKFKQFVFEDLRAHAVGHITSKSVATVYRNGDMDIIGKGFYEVDPEELHSYGTYIIVRGKYLVLV